MNTTNRDEMTNFLASQKPLIQQTHGQVIEKNWRLKKFEDLPFVSLTGGSNYGSSENSTGEDKISEYLRTQTPTVMIKEIVLSRGPNAVDANTVERFTEEILIPPLNTDIRFSAELPEHIASDLHQVSHTHPYVATFEDTNSYRPRQYDYDHRHKQHPHGFHIYDDIQENFSWAIPTGEDTVLDLLKKSLIHKVSAQHACGSCWFLYLYLNNSLFFVIKKYYDE